MDIEPRAIAAILLDSPVWARLALTAPDPRLRERAAERLGDYVADHLARPEPADVRQMVLPIG